MAEIENLDIQISASASQASASVDQLSRKFKALGASVQGGTEKIRASVALMHEGGNAASGFASKLRALAEFGSAFTHEFAKGFKQGFTDSISKGHSALAGFLKTAKRIAMYRLIREALRFITQGISEGMKNLYAWSSLADGTFKASMDSLATSAQYAGNSIAAMAAPLINALAPAVDYIIDKFVEMFNVINQILARLTGKGTYTAAVKTASAWSGAAKKAGGAANDMKKTILAFDEINKLADQNSGGGGGGSSADAGAMFEERAIDSKISEFVASIKLAINMENWQGLGKILGDKINELIDSIPWAEYGAKFGRYINAWFSTKYWTIHFTDFENIGKHIGEFLNNAISKIDWEIVGRSISQWPTKILDLFIGFIKEFDFGQAATAISDFIKGLLNEWNDWLERTDWADLGDTLVKKINDFLANLDYAGIAVSVANLMWNVIKAAIKLVGGMLGFGLDNTGKELGDIVSNALGNVASVLAGADMLIGAILLVTGHPLLGAAMLASGYALSYTVSALSADEITDEMKRTLSVIGGIISPALFALGAVLAFSGHPVIGIAMMAANAGAIAGAVALNWDSMPNTITKVITAIEMVVGPALMAIGAVLAFSGHPAVGIAMLAAGVVTTAAGILSWDGIPKEVRKVIASITAIVGPAFLAIGGILTFTGHPAIGIPLLISGIAATASAIINWDEVPEKIKSIISDVTGIIGKAALFLGILAMVGQMWGLGIKLVLLGIASLSVSAATNTNFDGITQKITKIVSDVVGVIAGASLFLGILAMITGNWPLGLALMVLGIAGLAATYSEEDWSALKDLGVKAFNTVAEGFYSMGALVLNIIGKWLGIGDHGNTPYSGDQTPEEYYVEHGGDMSAYNAVQDFNKSTAGLSYEQKVKEGQYLINAWGKNTMLTPDMENEWLGSAASIGKYGRKLGGIFSGGRWHGIPQFAGGGIFGSMFLAGEAGPELVGHVGNRTEVLNKSQIASAMFAAVRSAMAPTEIGMREAMSGGSTSDAYGNRGNSDTTLIELLREQNALLQEIAEKEITTSGINYAQRRANRRAGMVIAPVGT